MRIWRSWLEKLKDPNRDPYERRYRLLTMIMSVYLLWWAVMRLVIVGDLRGMLLIVLFVGFLFGTSCLALKYGKVQFDARLNAFLAILFLIPGAFLYLGGVQSGVPYFSLLIMVYTVSAIHGGWRVAYVIGNVLMTAASYVYTYLHPEQNPGRTVQEGYLNSVTLLVANLTITVGVFFFQLYMARQERDLLEQQRRETEDLNRSQNRFFSSMSHEIRTPINTIIGMNELVLRDETLSEETVTRLESIHSASNMLLSLINDILDVSKIESGKMDLVPVAYETADMVTEVTEMIAERAEEKGLKFQVQVDETLPVTLYGDEVRIKQVLVNLLNNAVKYTEQGSVTLSVQGDRLEDNHIRLTARVEDTGMGIRKEAMPHLFDAFKRMDEEKNRNIEGTGLGLSIVKQIMDLMGGEISVSSIYTKGSTFTMSVTQEIVDPTKIGSLNLLAHAGAGKREYYRQSFEAPDAKLLIVDDNEMNLQVESGLLKETKISIDTALSGAQALWRTLHTHYDVIFMDHLMPGMDGIECLREIREQEGGLSRETPVLVLTANAGAENQALYAASGFDGYLLKPVSGQQLESALIRALPEDKVHLTGSVTLQSETDQVFTQLGRKRNVVVTMDSGGDLPKEMTDKLGIGIINFVVHTGHGVFRDNLEIDSAELMHYLEHPGNHARSEVPDIAFYEGFFGFQLAKAQHIIHFTIAGSMSKSYANAVEAAKAFDNVTVVDSCAVSSGMGMLVLYASHLAQLDYPVSEILRRTEELRLRLRNSFVMDNGEYLKRGGRISSMLNLLLDAFLLHPMIEFRDMKLHSRVARRGNYRINYVRRVMRKYRNPDRSLLFIAHVGLTERELAEIRELVEKYVHFDRLYFVKASSAIAVNCGPGTLGLMFLEQGEGEERVFDFLPEETEAEDIDEPDAPGGRMDSAERLVRREDENPDPAAPRDDMVSGEHSLPLDLDEALRHCGSREVFDSALKLFVESAAAKADEIADFLRKEDWENYTIKVHALKSSARLIGATKLSEDAKELEALGNTAKETEE